MSNPIDHETIARAMKEAAWIAKHGTREEKAGRFLAAKRSIPELDRIERSKRTK